MFDTLTIDIETIPTTRADVRDYFLASVIADAQAKLAAVKAPSNYKDEAKIADYVAKTRADIEASSDDAIAEAIDKTGLEGAFGQIVCIGLAWNSDPVHVYCAGDTSLEQESKVIEHFFCHVTDGPTRFKVVGHNVAAFDLRFIKQRAIVHGLRPPLSLPFDAKPWDESIFDTMVQWAGVGKTIGMDKLCLALGIEGKCGISGADVWPMIQEGRFADVADYCKGDVERTRAIYNRMTFGLSQALRAAA